MSIIRRIGFIIVCLLASTEAFAQITLSVPLFENATQGTDYNPTPGASSYTGTGGVVLNILTGTAPFTCAVTVGAIPTSMTLDEVTPVSTPIGGCRIKGTPSAAGDFTFTLQVTDANSNTASQSVTVPVNTSSPLVFSAQSCGSPGVTTVTCTWTTGAAGTTQLCYGADNGFPKGIPGGTLTAVSGCTTETDLGGVTSHSVNLTGLWSAKNYFVYFISRGISGGVPQDYLFAYDEPGCSTNSLVPGCGVKFFTTATAASAGTADFGAQLYGPHNILQSYPAYVFINSWPIAGTTDIASTTHKFQITCAPTSCTADNLKVHWPEEQDLGGNVGTVSTTTTTDDTLTWVCCGSIAPTQFEILTNVGGTTPAATYTLTLTTTAGSVGPTVHTFTWTLNVAAPSFTFGSPSSNPPVPALSTWTANFTVATNPWNTPGDAQGICGFAQTAIGFYDGAWAQYQVGMWTGKSSPWGQQARVCSQNYQKYEINVIPSFTNWQGDAVYVFPHGQYFECQLYGIPTSCQGVKSLPTCCGGSMISASFQYGTADNAREAAWQLNAKRLDYDSGGTTTLAYVKEMAAYDLGNIDQYVNEDTNVLDESFFAGLMMQAAIEFYADPQTGNGDARVPQAVCGLADQLWNNWWVPWDGAAGGFPYEHRVWTSLKSAGWTGPGAFGNHGNALADLNNLIAPAYAWCYSITGQQKYQLEHDTIFNSSVLEPTAIGIAAAGKTWTQGYRWTFEGVLWRGATAPSGAGIGCFMLPQTGTCPRVQPPVAASGSPTL